MDGRPYAHPDADPTAVAAMRGSALPPAGRIRAFWPSFFLGVLTLGVYYAVWDYKVFHELDTEHGVPHASPWFWGWVSAQVAIVALYAVAIGLLVGGSGAFNPLAVVSGLISGVVAMAITALVCRVLYISREMRKFERIRSTYGARARIGPVGFLLMTTLGSGFIVPPMVAYYRLSASVNDVWARVIARGVRPVPVLPGDMQPT